ncbi:MAG TPA: SURF1 family protein [Acidimicrobiales bacterium]
MYRFLLRPRWLAFHLLVVVLVVVMVNLGLWQLSRLDERKARNEEIRSRQAAPVQPLDALLAEHSVDTTSEGGAVQWYTVVVTGTYDPTEAVQIRNRSLDGAPGEHAVTPLRADDGTAVLLNRGWVPSEQAVAGQVPPATSGPVTVVGRVRATQERGRFGPRDPADGDLDKLARVDIDRIQQQTPYPLAPVYVELVEQQPAAAELPRALPPPALDEGPHLSYAGQWFLFSLCAVAGWVLVVRKSARTYEQEKAAAAREVAGSGAELGDDGRGADDAGVVEQLRDDDRAAHPQ